MLTEKEVNRLSLFQNELYFASVRLSILVFKSQFFSSLNWLYGFYVVNSFSIIKIIKLIKNTSIQ